MKIKPEYFNLRYFNWKVYLHPHSDIPWADGRSGNPGVKLGRYSLGSTERETWLDNLHKLDLELAVANGRARPDQLQGTDVPQLLLETGRDIYERHCARAEVVGGGLAESTPKRYKAPLKKLIAFARSRGITTWNGVDKRLLHDYADDLEQNGYMYSTQYTEMTVILQTMKHLIEDAKLLPASAKIRLEMPPPDGDSTYCYTTQEVAGIVKWCSDRQHLTWLALIITILSHTGMRIGELRNARWSYIDKVPGMWTIPFRGRRGTLQQRKDGPRNKQKRTRNIPIVAEVRAVLDVLRQQEHADGLVVHGQRGGKLDDDTVREALVRDVLTPLSEQFPKASEDDRNLLDGRLHSFRHYFCSSCSNQNVPERAVASWLGHAGGKIIKRYYHLKDDQSLSLAARLKFI